MQSWGLQHPPTHPVPMNEKEGTPLSLLHNFLNPPDTWISTLSSDNLTPSPYPIGISMLIHFLSLIKYSTL